ncbi:hypothetical protein L1049_018955 [Liquidambar formosana]|uniref:Histone deacetylase n=1 Tax=Liquidambar formosana TaxID=63359 RepID=A0AAP0RBT1_LIQFO
MSTVPSSSTSIIDAEARKKRVDKSKLYIDVDHSKVPVIYSPGYNIGFFGMEKMHPFDSSKWGHVCQFLLSESDLKKNHIVEPEEASNDDLLVVHSQSYLNSLKFSATIAFIIEVPPVALLPNWLVRMKVLSPFRKQVGGTILAAKLAKERGWAINCWWRVPSLFCRKGRWILCVCRHLSLHTLCLYPVKHFKGDDC